MDTPEATIMRIEVDVLVPSNLAEIRAWYGDTLDLEAVAIHAVEEHVRRISSMYQWRAGRNAA